MLFIRQNNRKSHQKWKKSTVESTNLMYKSSILIWFHTPQSVLLYLFVYSVVKLSRCKIQNILCIPSHFGFISSKRWKYISTSLRHSTSQIAANLLNTFFRRLNFHAVMNATFPIAFAAPSPGKANKKNLCEMKTRAFTYLFSHFFLAPNEYSFDMVCSENKSSYHRRWRNKMSWQERCINICVGIKILEEKKLCNNVFLRIIRAHPFLDKAKCVPSLMGAIRVLTTQSMVCVCMCSRVVFAAVHNTRQWAAMTHGNMELMLIWYEWSTVAQPDARM